MEFPARRSFQAHLGALGIANQIFRITRIAYGELIDGKITIDAVEDIFGIEDTAFVAPPVSGWAICWARRSRPWLRSWWKRPTT